MPYEGRFFFLMKNVRRPKFFLSSTPYEGRFSDEKCTQAVIFFQRLCQTLKEFETAMIQLKMAAWQSFW